MTNEQGATEADVKIRTPARRTWMLFLVAGGGYLAFTPLVLMSGWPWFLFVALFLPLGCAHVALALHVRTLGVDLTAEFAIVHGYLRRSTVPWRNVGAVVSHLNSNGTSAVWLILENGKHVTLAHPATGWRRGDALYERELRQIDQWWQAHRAD